MSRKVLIMRLRPTNCCGLLLSLLLVVGIIVGAPSAARAQFWPPWTTAGSAGTMDQDNLAKIALDGPTAILTASPGSATIRYNVVGVGGLDPLLSGGCYRMVVRYRATPHSILPGAGSRVVARLIEVNINSGISTTRMVFDSNNWEPSIEFQTHFVDAGFLINFHENAYYIEAELSRVLLTLDAPAIQAISLSAGCLT